MPVERLASEFRGIEHGTVHDRFQAWREQGVFERLWQAGLVEYAQEIGIDWEWNVMDGAMLKAPLGGKSNRGKSH